MVVHMDYGLLTRTRLSMDYAGLQWTMTDKWQTTNNKRRYAQQLLCATLLFLNTVVASALLLLFRFDCAVVAFWSLLVLYPWYVFTAPCTVVLASLPKFSAVFFLLHAKVVDVFVASAFLVDPFLKCVEKCTRIHTGPCRRSNNLLGSMICLNLIRELMRRSVCSNPHLV